MPIGSFNVFWDFSNFVFCKGSNDATEYTALKIEFENNVQELEMRLTKFASTYLLNREKLDYNLQVITQRQKEAVSIVTSHKNALNRSRDILNNLTARYDKMENKYQTENRDLTEEYKRLTKQLDKQVIDDN